MNHPWRLWNEFNFIFLLFSGKKCLSRKDWRHWVVASVRLGLAWPCHTVPSQAKPSRMESWSRKYSKMLDKSLKPEGCQMLNYFQNLERKHLSSITLLLLARRCLIFSFFRFEEDKTSWQRSLARSNSWDGVWDRKDPKINTHTLGVIQIKFWINFVYESIFVVNFNRHWCWLHLDQIQYLADSSSASCIINHSHTER